MLKIRTQPKMADALHVDDLPTDVLLLILDYCTEYDLLQLSKVCKRFYEIVRTNVVWSNRTKRYLATNEMSRRFRERCSTTLSSHTKWIVSLNWSYGIYKKRMIAKWKKLCIPCMKMTDDLILWSTGFQLCGVKRKVPMNSDCNRYFYMDSLLKNNYAHLISEICKFVLWKDYIICGYLDGSVKYFLIEFDNSTYRLKKILMNEFISNRGLFPNAINAIDATSENVIVGFEQGKVKILKHPDLDMPPIKIYDESKNYIDMKDLVRSLSIDPTRVKFAVGTAGLHNIPPLHIIDIERYTMANTIQHTWKYGAGILDMIWEDPNTLLTCGYDTYIRKWDLRIGKCVCSWADPTDATLFCISSDYHNTIVTGTQYNTLAVLWDQRQRDFVQLYYVNSDTMSQYRPIYSIEFDNLHLYCATDKNIVELNFSSHLSQKTDYKSLNIF